MKSSFHISICNFTNVYSSQLQLLGRCTEILDCSDTTGTDCYCDNESACIIHEKIAGIPVQGVHIFDSGNYHYMSKLWTDKIQESFDLLVFDHHPDMQPPRFEGILSCGGWLKEVLDKNKFVQNVIVVGVADHLVEELQSDESAEFAKYENRVTFIKESEIIVAGRKSVARGKTAAGDKSVGTELAAVIMSTIAAKARTANCPLYISIDKDVLRKEDAETNWDQGSLSLQGLCGILQDICKKRKIMGVDICGERTQNMDFMNVSAADTLNEKASLAILKSLGC